MQIIFVNSRCLLQLLTPFHLSTYYNKSPVIWHRFYGTSVPFGSIELAMADHQVRGCLTTDQALQDFAIIIQSLKANLSTLFSPVIVVGKGYGGALATWFRLKYPEIAIGAISSSAPMYLFGNTTQPDGFCSIISQDFQEANLQCYNSIRDSWKKIDELASQPNGIAKLSSTFNTCRPLHSAMEIEDFLGQVYSKVAVFNDPHDRLLNFLCLSAGKGTLEGIAQVPKTQFLQSDCLNNTDIEVNSPFELFSKVNTPWEWQRCSELIFPIGCSKDTMLRSRPFNQTKFEQACRKRFGIVPQPRTPISFFARKSLAESLVGFGGNIIFTNGLRDPFSGAGILEDLSKTIVAVNAERGTFSNDMKTLCDDDPEWLKNHIKKVSRLCRPWVNHYFHIGSHYSVSSVLSYIILAIILAVILVAFLIVGYSLFRQHNQ